MSSLRWNRKTLLCGCCWTCVRRSCSSDLFHEPNFNILLFEQHVKVGTFQLTPEGRLTDLGVWAQTLWRFKGVGNTNWDIFTQKNAQHAGQRLAGNPTSDDLTVGKWFSVGKSVVFLSVKEGGKRWDIGEVERAAEEKQENQEGEKWNNESAQWKEESKHKLDQQEKKLLRWERSEAWRVQPRNAAWWTSYFCCSTTRTESCQLQAHFHFWFQRRTIDFIFSSHSLQRWEVVLILPGAASVFLRLSFFLVCCHVITVSFRYLVVLSKLFLWFKMTFIFSSLQKL